MSKQIVPNELKTHILEQLIESVTEVANTSYYAFVGDHVADGDTQEDVTQPSGSFRGLTVDTFKNMIFGKRINSNDIVLVVKRYDWVENTVYAMYDDEDPDLFSKNFFVVVDEDSFKHVYKCLYNAGGAPSTSKPVFADVTFDEDLFESGDNYYETADGYQWKYLYSINTNDFKKFSTEEFIPVLSNTSVINTAINGSIDVIKVDTFGRNYDNYIKNGEFKTGDLRVGNTTTYRISGPASTVTNFYKDTILHITSGPGSGQFKRIKSSFANNTGVMVVTEKMDLSDADSFSIAPQISSTYEISPEVKIYGAGDQTVNAFARAIINENSSNNIQKVEILNPGENYSYATANVSNMFVLSSEPLGNVANFSPASVRPILSPTGGHGSNPSFELGARAIAFSIEFSRSESNTIPTENSYATFGIIRDPLFANVEINHERLSIENTPGSDGSFISGEKIYQIKRIQLSGNVSIEEQNNVVVAVSNTTSYDEFLEPGQFVYITDEDVVNRTFISKITSVTNSTSFIVEDRFNFSSNSCSLYLTKVTANAEIRDVFSSSKIFMRNADDHFEVGTEIIGTESYATARITGIDANEKFGINNSQYTFSPFLQMTRCVGEFSSGSGFINDEIVFQGDQYKNSSGDIVATATARVFSSNESTVNLTRVEGVLNTNTVIKGVTSGSVFGSSGSAKFTKYEGDLEPTKGNIIYLRNDVPVTRLDTQAEQIRVILEF